jgi:phosphate transport system substrate-binding protein
VPSENLSNERSDMRPTILSTLLCVVACSSNPAAPPPAAEEANEPGAKPGEGPAAAPAQASNIAIDGSSTVFPISEAVAEEFQKATGTRVTIGVSGTGGGFKKLCKGEVVIAGASRPIKPSEVELCKTSNVEYIELPVAYDGLAVTIHPSNTFAETMTVAELKKIWEPEAQGKVMKWSDVRKGWPNKEIHLFGAGVDSGTYDYFTLAINGKEHASRGDYTSSEDDNVLVQGVAGDPLALGFFGYAYVGNNGDKLKPVAVDDGDAKNGEGGIKPSPETVANGTYQPLSRPIFIYVSKAAASRPEVAAFVDYYMTKGTPLVKETGYIPLPARGYELAHARFKAGKTGSLFEGHGSKVGVTVEALLAGE